MEAIFKLYCYKIGFVKPKYYNIDFVEHYTLSMLCLLLTVHVFLIQILKKKYSRGLIYRLN